MTDETKVEDLDGAKTAPAIAKPVLIGRKVGMLQHFKEDGSVVAATVIAAESNVITQVRTRERDGYTAIQHGFDHLRRQGSVGSGTTPGRVLRGLRMAAHQGADRVTVRNLEILRSDPARALLVVAGAVPGARNGIVMVRKA